MAKLIHHHLGLGDHFVCYGLVRKLAEQEHIYLFTKNEYLTTVDAMYKNTNVTPIPVRNDFDTARWENHPDFRRIGFSNHNEEKFGAEFYHQANMDYNTRWQYQIDRDLKREQELLDFFGTQKVFIHDDAKRGYAIKMEGFRPEIYYTRNLMDYGLIIENAEEVRCIESSFRLYCDFLQPKGKLYLHYDKEKSFRIVPTKHTWEQI